MLYSTALLEFINIRFPIIVFSVWKPLFQGEKYFQIAFKVDVAEPVVLTSAVKAFAIHNSMSRESIKLVVNEGHLM
jgi:hypothetical protein